MSERESYIDAFIKTINKGPFKDLKNCADETGKVQGAIPGVEEPDIYDRAVYQAYLDMCRTVSGVSKNDTKRKTSVIAARNSIASRLNSFFEEDIANNPSETCFDCKICFDCWHKETMDEAKTLAEFLTYGQVQKIINMAFKYLYCCKDIRDKKSDHFVHCHMALDNYTLAWFERTCKGVFEKRVGSKYRHDDWSKITDPNKYFDIINAARCWLKKSKWPDTENLFIAEFSIWRHESSIVSLHEVIKAADGIAVPDDIKATEARDCFSRLVGCSKQLKKLEQAMKGYTQDCKP